MCDEIKRYGYVQYEGFCEVENGAYVKFEDYKKKIDKIMAIAKSFENNKELSSVDCLETIWKIKTVCEGLNA